MNLVRTGRVCVAVLLAAQLMACATIDTKSQKAELQKDAVNRWHACLDRHISPPQSEAVSYRTVINDRCDGHKRDVIASFPLHLEAQVEEILVSNAYRYFEANDQNHSERTSAEAIRTLMQ